MPKRRAADADDANDASDEAEGCNKGGRETYVVKSALHVTSPRLRDEIEATVQLLSRVESLGNAVFSLAVLTQAARGRDGLTEHFVLQSFVCACLRAAMAPPTETIALPAYA